MTMRNAWRVAETYPIEGFWETQIVVNGEVVAIAKGRSQAESKKRAESLACFWNKSAGASMKELGIFDPDHPAMVDEVANVHDSFTCTTKNCPACWQESQIEGIR